MPLTKYQLELAKLIAVNRSAESHLAGGAALNWSPNSHRYSNDLDYFHDSEERVASAYEADRKLLIDHGYKVTITMNQPGFIRTIVAKGPEETKVEWGQDSSWRFMPVISHPDTGFQLHPVDLAINKILALAGRDEARDFIDTIFLNREFLSLGAMCWAACGKDPGFSPPSLLEILKRRGKNRPEEIDRLMLTAPVDLKALKEEWRSALEQASEFFSSRPIEEVGCLYFSTSSKKFITPKAKTDDYVLHWGQPRGVLPRILSGTA